MPQRIHHEAPPATVNGSTFLEKVVVPILESRLPLPEGEADGDGDFKLIKRSREKDGSVLVHAPWNTTQILCVSFDRRDDHRATISFDLHAGLFLANAPTAVLQLGPLLEATPFNIHFGPELVSGGSISIGCQLHIHPGDTDLVAKRTRQLVQLAYDLDWFTSIYLPERLGFGQQAHLESTFGPDCFEDGELPDRLEDGIRDKEGKVDTAALLILALGLGQWKDILRIIARNSRITGSEDLCAPSLGARAWQELGRWDRVVTMAKSRRHRGRPLPQRPLAQPLLPARPRRDRRGHRGPPPPRQTGTGGAGILRSPARQGPPRRRGPVRSSHDLPALPRRLAGGHRDPLPGLSAPRG